MLPTSSRRDRVTLVFWWISEVGRDRLRAEVITLGIFVKIIYTKWATETHLNRNQFFNIKLKSFNIMYKETNANFLFIAMTLKVDFCSSFLIFISVVPSFRLNLIEQKLRCEELVYNGHLSTVSHILIVWHWTSDHTIFFQTRELKSSD